MYLVHQQEDRCGGTGEARAGGPGVRGHFCSNREFEFSLPCPKLKETKTQESEGRREVGMEERREDRGLRKERWRARTGRKEERRGGEKGGRG